MPGRAWAGTGAGPRRGHRAPHDGDTPDGRALENDPPHRLPDIGAIAVACALGDLDFRFREDPWLEGHPKLTARFKAFARNPCTAQDRPRE